MVVAVVSVSEVFKVSLGMIQQRLLEQIVLTFQFLVVEVFKVLARDRLQVLHPLTHVVLRMRLLHGFSHFSSFFLSEGLGPHSGSELAAGSSPSTRRACGVSMAVEEDESEPVTESELEDEGEINA